MSDHLYALIFLSDTHDTQDNAARSKFILGQHDYLRKQRYSRYTLNQTRDEAHPPHSTKWIGSHFRMKTGRRPKATTKIEVKNKKIVADTAEGSNKCQLLIQ